MPGINSDIFQQSVKQNYYEYVKRVSQNSSFFNVKDIWKRVLNRGVHLSLPRFGKLQNSIKKMKKITEIIQLDSVIARVCTQFGKRVP